MLFVDSNDRERIQEVRDEFNRLLSEEELRDAFCLVIASKQDLPNVMSLAEIRDALDLPRLMKDRHWVLMPTRLPVDKQELDGHMDWLVASIRAERNQVARRARQAAYKQKLAQSQAQRKQKQAQQATAAQAAATAAGGWGAAAGAGAGGGSGAGGASGGGSGGEAEMDVLERWLQVEDEPDDEFLRKLEDYSLDVWDHRTHLRLAWLYLTRHGRREGLARIHSAIQSFIANSPVTKRKTGTTYHETMTYFWAHMVHFCIASMKAPQQQGKEPDFKTFLLFNPLLTNGGLFLHYYSKDLMLKNPEARKQVVLPDKRPLPSLVTSVESIKQLQQNQARYGKKPAAGSGPAGPATAVTAAAPPIALSDDEFLQRFLGRGLDRWSHATMLRAVYCCLRAHGRRHGGKLALDALAALQGEHAHTTLNYFWLTMLTHTLAAEHSAALFADRPAPPPLRKAPKRVEEEEGAGGQGKVAEAPSRQEPEPTSAVAAAAAAAAGPSNFTSSAKATAAVAVAAVAGMAGIALGEAAGTAAESAAESAAAGGSSEDWVEVDAAALSGTAGRSSAPAAAHASAAAAAAGPAPGSGAPPPTASPPAPMSAPTPVPPPPQLPEWSALLGSGSYASVRLQELVADESRYLAHYNKKTIFSDAAAAGFVPPDKKPLPTTV